MAAPAKRDVEAQPRGDRRPPTGGKRVVREAATGGGDQTGLERVIFFSDAVFAIAMTLLVIDLRLPDLGASATSKDFTHGLANLEPSFFAFVVSFLVIALYWMAHHRMFGYVRDCDTTLIWINNFLLMSIVFLPFSSSVISHYGDLVPAVTFYAGSLSATGSLFLLLWVYVSHKRRFVDKDLDPRVVRTNYIRTSVPPVIFLISIPLAKLTTNIELFWLTIPLFTRAVERLAGDPVQD